MKYLFGPVNSRRLGRSLGIDLVPFKTCTLDCVYCECGRTTVLTDRADEYVPTDAVIRELDEFLDALESGGGGLDAITFAGSGEPTLHSGIGAIIGHLKDRHPRYRVVVLTNGTLLWRDEVRRALVRADTVIPSLDAAGDEAFGKIGRGCAGLTPALVIDGLVAFRREFAGELLLEVFIIPGLNDTDAELARFRDAVARIRPDGIQLNSLDRPGSEEWVGRATRAGLLRVQEALGPYKTVIVGKPGDVEVPFVGIEDRELLVRETLKRRPSTIADLAQSLGISEDEVRFIIERIRTHGELIEESGERGMFFRITGIDGSEPLL